MTEEFLELIKSMVLTPSNLFLREQLNGALIPLNICILFMIGTQMFAAWRRHGKKMNLDWTREPGIWSACAFWWIFMADLIRASLAWYLLREQSKQVDPVYLNSGVTMLYIASALIALLATLRLVYALSPNRIGHSGWVAALFLTLLVVVTLNVV